jgi:hypothetical protein
MRSALSTPQTHPSKYLEKLNMNRTEAKAYALDELGLDRDQVRQFGNLSRTQTWLDAIAAQASGGIAAQASGGIAAAESESEPAETAAPSLETLALASAELRLPWETMPEDSFITFWESDPEPVLPQPLTVLSALDGAWDDPEPDSAATSLVMVYPIVIAVIMLWALVQLLLLGGKAICWLLSGIATGLDAIAQERLQRTSTLKQTPQGFTFAVP